MKNTIKPILFILVVFFILFTPLPYIHFGNVVCKPGQTNCPKNNQILFGQSIFQHFFSKINMSNNLKLKNINEKESKPFVAKESDYNYCEKQTDCVLYRSPYGDPAGLITCVSIRNLKNNDYKNILSDQMKSQYPGICKCLIESKRCFLKRNINK
ncbi:MAG: hypothetical protein Q7R95_09170 [bacterium]|nr:hypothetical protein [bacterium]